MFGFGWVRTHLGVVFGDAFGLFWGSWLDFWKKEKNQQNLGNFRGLTPRCKDPHAAVLVHVAAWPRGGFDKLWVRHIIAVLCRGEGLHRSVVVLCHGIATIHGMELSVFCFVLFFHCYEDLSIVQMRTL